MSRPTLLPLALIAAACESYSPAPVDLNQHLRAFEDRSGSIPRFAEQNPGFDVSDGITLAEARAIALVHHPDCRLARRRAGVAHAHHEESGRFADPRLGVYFERILENLPRRWLTATGVAWTLPLTGRLGLQRALAAAELDTATLDARIAEHRTLVALDRAWVNWCIATERERVSQAFVEQTADLTTIAQKLAAAGQLDRTQARVFELERTSRQNTAGIARDALAVARLQLLRQLGLHPAAEVRFVQTATPSESLIAERTPPSARRTLLFTGPQVARARLRHAESERSLELEIRKQWPDLGFTPGHAEEDGQPRATIGFTLPLPIFNRNARAIAAARAERELRGETLRVALEQATQDLAIAEQQLQLARARRQRIENELLPLAEQQLQDSRTLADRGRLDPLLLLDALRRLFDARLARIDAIAAANLAQVTVDSAFWNLLPAMRTPEVES